MSHRVTVQTEIKSKDLVIGAIKKMDHSFTEVGNVVTITNGKLRGVTINCGTGELVGDTDRQTEDTMGAIRQFYAEQKTLQECRKQGILVTSRKIDQKTGDIVLRLSANFG